MRRLVLGLQKDEEGQPHVDVLADALHPYPATKIGFHPSTLRVGDSVDASDKSRHSDWSVTDQSDANVSLASVSSTSTVPTEADAYNENDTYPDLDLLASSADCLHIWEMERNEDVSEMYGAMSLRSSMVSSKKPPAPTPRFLLKEKCALAHAKSTASPPAPLTSFSWNEPSPNLIVTSSIDTTCTIWDLPTRSALTQLIAHDREVYDVDWCPGSADVFASVGADGSVRVFDLRNLEHSTIIYETTSDAMPHTDRRDAQEGSYGTNVPLLRISFNPWDANYLATFHLQSETVQILDVRAPGVPILELRGHSGSVNSVAWGPPSQGLGRNGPSKGMVCTGGDDAQCLVYDLASATLRTASAQGRRSRNSMYNRSNTPNDGLRIGAEVPVLAYTAPSMVNNVSWMCTPFGSKRASAQYKHRSFYRNLLNEWTDYTSSSTATGADWLALCAGKSVKILRV
ncbi:wd40 repeat-like protein [Malassezia pachydermatis]|uniref:Wd40 repeat-like protein n=1 Tax=Malassezia pachydermatis TaxID=77020 RepID=A0A0M8MWY6_9BASI|nr:wd40 repeat-like protein [Malassezia pachydermatis]KOS15954.1 wd40 repeat-like protein [Malassezia pachydermatis]